jgi:hypothetical protein
MCCVAQHHIMPVTTAVVAVHASCPIGGFRKTFYDDTNVGGA